MIRKIIINQVLHIMNTRETLVLKTLLFKELSTTGSSMAGDLIDKLLDQDPTQADKLTKNVCARIPLPLAEEMENLGGLLGLNKREVITLALRDFLEKAKDTITEFDAWPKGEEA